MKKVILPFARIIAVQAFVVAANMGPSPTIVLNKLIAAFEWVSTTHDFGTIKKDVAVEHEFEFTNTGSEPLLISSVKASCGCTVTDYTKEQIPAGEKGYVKAKYNAAKVGVFTKSVTVTANTESGSVQLYIKGEVVD
jgi:hypothetical protein